MFRVDMGIMAYNEENNIGALLESVIAQAFSGSVLESIVVVVSGSTDRTAEIAGSYARKDKRIKVLFQERREGKASAVNLFLSQASGDIVILESADTIPEKGALNRLVEVFADERIGMSGARPVPVNSGDTFVGFTVQLMWRLHHAIALESPKLGELVAFRNVIPAIPADTAVDEAAIETLIQDKGYRLCYVPEALVLNKGPQTLGDFIRQRRRIFVGHKALIRRHNYKVSTFSPSRIAKYLLKDFSGGAREFFWTLQAVALELFCRMLGAWDYYVLKKNHAVWDMALSTKKL